MDLITRFIDKHSIRHNLRTARTNTILTKLNIDQVLLLTNFIEPDSTLRLRAVEVAELAKLLESKLHELHCDTEFLACELMGNMPAYQLRLRQESLKTLAE